MAWASPLAPLHGMERGAPSVASSIVAAHRRDGIAERIGDGRWGRGEVELRHDAGGEAFEIGQRLALRLAAVEDFEQQVAGAVRLDHAADLVHDLIRRAE